MSADFTRKSSGGDIVKTPGSASVLSCSRVISTMVRACVSVRSMRRSRWSGVKTSVMAGPLVGSPAWGVKVTATHFSLLSPGIATPVTVRAAQGRAVAPRSAPTARPRLRAG